jgi:hypothetical protein
VTNLNDAGAGSLRQAIIDTPSGGTVDFQPALSGTITLTTGELAINKDLTITGPGADVITVSGSHASRVLEIISGGFHVALSGLTLADGASPDSGGGIYNVGGTLTLTGSALRGNSAGSGGGIYNLNGTLTLTGSTLRGNSGGNSGLGAGGIYNNGGAVAIAGSTLSGNSAFGVGGIENNGVSSSMTITDSTVSGNNGHNSGGISNSGTLTVIGATLSDDSACSGFCSGVGFGGGISNSGTLTVIGSTFMGNSSGSVSANAEGIGGGIYNEGKLTISNSIFVANSSQIRGGGIDNNYGNLTVTDSTFSGNLTLRLFGDGGGGISNHLGAVTVTRSAFIGNSSGNTGGGISGHLGTLTLTNSTLNGNSSGNAGGGIYGGFTTMAITNSTLSGNTATGSSGEGGGIYDAFVAGGSVNLTSSTLAANSASNDGGGLYVAGSARTLNTILAGNTAAQGPDLFGNLGSLGYNLIQDPSQGSGFDSTDWLGLDPMLAPLQDNGGPTQTTALLAGSPALNAGDPNQRGTSDQRGAVRAGGVNIGAYQASASRFVLTAPARVTAGMPFDLTVTAVDIFGQVAAGYTGTVTFSTTDPDPGVVLPADYSFTLTDGGVHTFTDTGLGETTLRTRGRQTITAADTGDGSILGSVTVKVRLAGHAPPLLWAVASQPATPGAVQAPTRQAPHEPSQGQPAQSEATSAPVPLAMARHAQDAVFEGWDTVPDGPALTCCKGSGFPGVWRLCERSERHGASRSLR